MPTKQTEQGGFVWVPKTEEKAAVDSEPRKETTSTPTDTITSMWERRTRASAEVVIAEIHFEQRLKARLWDLIPTVTWEAKPLNDEVRLVDEDIWLSYTLDHKDTSELAEAARILLQYDKKLWLFDNMTVEARRNAGRGSTTLCLRTGTLHATLSSVKTCGLTVDWSAMKYMLDGVMVQAKAWRELRETLETLLSASTVHPQPTMHYESEVLP